MQSLNQRSKKVSVSPARAVKPLGSITPFKLYNSKKSFYTADRSGASTPDIVRRPRQMLAPHTPQSHVRKADMRSLSPMSSSYSFSKENLATSSRMDKYAIGKIIGQGAYAVVKEAVDKTTNEKVAIKIYEKSSLIEPLRRDSVDREIKIVKKISHPHILNLIETVDTPKHLHLVTDFIGGPSLYTYLKKRHPRRLDESDCRRLFVQIVSALAYCHSQGVAHRDIKLENILLDEAEKKVKLIDFGFATCMPGHKKVRMFCGTPSYIAPEILKREEYAGPPADIWALGVLLYALLCGAFPYKGTTDKELYANIKSGNITYGTHMSESVIELIKMMLSINPSERPSCQDILGHAWVQGGESEIDAQILQYIMRLGYSEQVIFESLKSPHNYISLLYSRLKIKKNRGELFSRPLETRNNVAQ